MPNTDFISKMLEIEDLIVDEITTSHFDSDIMEVVYHIKKECLENLNIFAGCRDLHVIATRMEVSFIDLSKTESVKDVIVKHNPNIICDVKHENANIVLENDIELLKSCDLIISTTASSTLEYHLISKFNKGIIDTLDEYTFYQLFSHSNMLLGTLFISI